MATVTIDPSAARRGVLSAAVGYLAWGLLPLYWKQLHAVEALELIAHRLVWSLLFLTVVLALRSGRSGWWRVWRNPRTSAWCLLSGSLLTANWLIFVWAVNRGFVIECSLGYFLVPLFNALLGRVCYRETLRLAQRVALVLAAIGVALLVIQVGRIPWIALGLAGTFSFYGLLRKRSELGPLTGLATETGLMAPFAIGWLAWCHHTGTGALDEGDLGLILGVISTGVVTTVPLLLFAYGARRLRLTTLGLLQYIAPTGQFLLGWLFYDEALTLHQALAFGFIWLGLACYSIDAWKVGAVARRAQTRRPLNPV